MRRFSHLRKPHFATTALFGVPWRTGAPYGPPTRSPQGARKEIEWPMTDMSGLDDRGKSDDQQGGTSSPGNDSQRRKGPDLSELARDWITLWQSELSAMAADREMREAWQTTLALWAGLVSSALRAASVSSAPRAAPRHESASGTADAARAEAPAAAPDARDAEIEHLARHVAALEARLAELEHGGHPRSPRKRKS
jgi:hypothetical protein